MRSVIWLCVLTVALSGCMQNIKEPSHAGGFYPADAADLRETVGGLLAAAGKPAEEGDLVALIAPHAGYRYSGSTAAKAVAQLAGRNIHTVIIIGASHHSSFPGAAVYAKGGMRTPLGIVKVNEDIAQVLIDRNSGVLPQPEVFGREHVIEVLLPLLQGLGSDIKVVPLLIGDLPAEKYETLAKVLSGIMRNDDRVMLVASTDLSHYYGYETASEMDGKIIGAIERMSVEEVDRYFATGESGACGKAPLLVTMMAAARLGASSGRTYEYRNTGDVTGDHGRVVGYAAMGLYRKSLDAQEREKLLSLARRTVEEYVAKGGVPSVTLREPRLNAYGTTFVTVTRKGVLRGCIGNVRNPMPLYKSVIMNAIAASTKDQRFPPVKEEELKDLRIEVSVLSAFEPLDDVSEIEIGRHGLYLVKGTHTSILLPQVAEEAGWDVETYLDKLAVKAGLQPEDWMNAQLFRFTAEVIK